MTGALKTLVIFLANGTSMKKLSILFLFFILQIKLGSYAKPYLPQNDSQIIERLSTKVGGNSSAEVRKLRSEIAKNPKDLKLALNTAKHFIELGRIESDPRYLGYAESVISSWLKVQNPLPEILVLRATISQSNHDFDGALKDLDIALKENSTNAQAWLTKAVILQTKGNYAEAKRSCIPLLRLADELTTISCISSASSLNGDALKSFNILKSVVEKSKDAPVQERLWALTILGEIAARRGEDKSAEKYFKEAFLTGLYDNYLLSSYSDFLLSKNRTKEVVNLLSDKTRIDNLLLRLALAEKDLNSLTLSEHIKDLQSRFLASHLRGDNVHRREEAIFELKLQNNSKKALELSEKNWNVQREPLDVKIFLESAIASGDKASAREVIEFIEKNKLEDVEINELIEKSRL